jgi:hypothetical protein
MIQRPTIWAIDLPRSPIAPVDIAGGVTSISYAFEAMTNTVAAQHKATTLL